MQRQLLKDGIILITIFVGIFRIATFAISLIPRNPAENSIYTEQVGIKLCTKTGFYGGLQITCDTDNLFYIAIGI